MLYTFHHIIISTCGKWASDDPFNNALIVLTIIMLLLYFVGLAVGLGIGAIAEVAKQSFGGKRSGNMC